jgi:hypothetical protein
MSDNAKEAAGNGSGASLCYAAGWRPEKALKNTVLELVAIVFDESSTVDECEMAASTIVETVHPEIMDKATGEDHRWWDSA